MEARLRMSVLIGGFVASQMLYVAARLKLADLLAGGPMTIADLARECGAKEVPLRRVVRGLAAFGVFEIHEDGRFANNWLSECLRSGAQDSVREMALLYGEESDWLRNLSAGAGQVVRGGRAFALTGTPRVSDTRAATELSSLSAPARAYCRLADKQVILELGESLPGFGPHRAG